MFINVYIARPIYNFILIYTCGLTVVIKRICYVILCFDGVQQFPLYPSFVKNPLIYFLCCPRNLQNLSQSFYLKI